MNLKTLRAKGPPSARAGEVAVSATLELEDGTTFQGQSFSAHRSVAGEAVFNTSLVGYPESLTDPSYSGQILVCTYPLIGNYGVTHDESENTLCKHFESERVQVEGLIVGDYCRHHSHWNAGYSLSEWLTRHGVPALTGIDTRAVTKRLREKGTMRAIIRFGNDQVTFRDPNEENLVAAVSSREPHLYAAPGATRRVALLDCGVKHNIIRSLLTRGLEVLRVPWDYDVQRERLDALVISNGPGNPKSIAQTVDQIRGVLDRGLPTFGICMGHQLLALAIGAETYKLKYGHRGQNQPVLECGTQRCFITAQNHGYAVDQSTLPRSWHQWFVNLNDDTCEGLRHARAPFQSVQFHPEAAPGPVDTAFLFDEFARMIHG